MGDDSWDAFKQEVCHGMHRRSGVKGFYCGGWPAGVRSCQAESVMDGIGSMQNPDTVTRKGAIRLLFLIVAVLLHVAAFSALVGWVVWPAPPVAKDDFAAVPLRVSLPPPVPAPDSSFTTNVAVLPGIQMAGSPAPYFKTIVPEFLIGTKPKPVEAGPEWKYGFAVPGVATEFLTIPPHLLETPLNPPVSTLEAIMSPLPAGHEIIEGKIRVGDVRKTWPKSGTLAR